MICMHLYRQRIIQRSSFHSLHGQGLGTEHKILIPRKFHMIFITQKHEPKLNHCRLLEEWQPFQRYMQIWLMWTHAQAYLIFNLWTNTEIIRKRVFFVTPNLFAIQACTVSYFLSDPSPIIGYACQWLPNWLTDSLLFSGLGGCEWYQLLDDAPKLNSHWKLWKAFLGWKSC